MNVMDWLTARLGVLDVIQMPSSWSILPKAKPRKRQNGIDVVCEDNGNSIFRIMNTQDLNDAQAMLTKNIDIRSTLAMVCK